MCKSIIKRYCACSQPTQIFTFQFHAQAVVTQQICNRCLVSTLRCEQQKCILQIPGLDLEVTATPLTSPWLQTKTQEDVLRSGNYKERLR